MASRRNKTGVAAQQTESPEFDAFDSLSSSDIEPDEINDIKQEENDDVGAEPAITIPTKVRNDGPVRVETAQEVKEEPADYTEDMKEEFCGLQIAPPKTNKQIALTSKEGAHNNNDYLPSVEPYLPSSATKLTDVSPTNCSDRSVVDSNQNNLASASKKLNASDANEYSRKLRDRSSLTGKKEDKQFCWEPDSESEDSDDNGSSEDCSDSEYEPIITDLFSCANVDNNSSGSADGILRSPSSATIISNTGDSQKTKEASFNQIVPFKRTRKYKCNVCSKWFVSRSGLRFHKRIHTGERPFACSICDKRFTQKPDLQAHEMIHTGDKPFKCDVCDKRFNQPRYLAKHKRFHTGKKPFACSVCDKRFIQNSDLQKHQLVHTVERPFKCDECKRSFNHLSTLVSHKRLHTGERPYVCSICDERFIRKSKLQQHMLIHPGILVGEKPFKCDVCKKSFNNPEPLMNHKIIHTGEMPFSCSVCDKLFNENRWLQRHKLIHRGGEAYACMYCRFPFDTREAMVNHREKEHPTTSQVQNLNISTATGSTSIDYNNREGSTEKELNGSNEASANNTYRNDLDLPSNSVSLSSSSATNKEMVKKDVKQSHSNIESSDIVGWEPEKAVANGDKSIDSSQNSPDCENTLKERIATAVNEYSRKLRDKSSLIGKKADVQSYLEPDSVSEGSHDDQSSEEDCSDSEYEQIITDPFSSYNEDNNSSDAAVGMSPSPSARVTETAISSLTSIGLQKTNEASKNIACSKSAKLFKCHVCEKTFNRKGNLQVHELIHTGEKPFSCSICEMRFSRYCHFQRHLQGHTGEKPFACSICDKRFRDKYALKLHAYIHNGGKTFDCSICDKSFSNNSYLRGHQVTHTGKKPHQCSICKKSFLRKYDVTKHFRRIHEASLFKSTTFNILIDSAEKKSNASAGNNANISTGDDLAPNSSNNAAHSSSIKKEVKKELKRKTISRKESSDKVHLEPEQKKSRKKDSQKEPTSTELGNNNPEHVNNQKISYEKGSIEEELERIASAPPNILYLVWSEEFSLDLALAVARNSSNCILILKNFSSTSLVEVGNMVETNDSSVVEIGPNPDSLRFFSFGRMILPRKILDNGRFKSISELESTMTKFFFVQGMQLVNVIQFTQGVDGWFVTLKRHLKEDLIITNT